MICHICVTKESEHLTAVSYPRYINSWMVLNSETDKHTDLLSSLLVSRTKNPIIGSLNNKASGVRRRVRTACELSVC